MNSLAGNPKSVPVPATDTASAPRGFLQVCLNFTQHLVRLNDLDGSAGRVEAKRLPKAVNDCGMDTSLESAAEVDWKFVGLLVITGCLDSFARRHTIRSFFTYSG